MHSATAPARAPGVATPSGFRQPRLWRGLPRHPAPTGPPRSRGPGVSARSLPAPPTGGTRSLTGSRRCPRSMTPGTAAAPAPGCWPRLLRPAADGGALRKLRRVGLRLGKAADEAPSGQRQQAGLLCPSAAAAAPAHNQSLYAVSGDVDSTAYNAGLCAIALQGQQHLTVTGYGWRRQQHLRPPAERPAAAARCCSSTGRAGGRGGRHLGRSPATVRAGHGLRQSRAAPLRGPPPPPIPPSGGAAWAASACAAPAQPRAGSRRVRLSQHSTKPLPVISNPAGALPSTAGRRRWHSISDAAPRTARE